MLFVTGLCVRGPRPDGLGDAGARGDAALELRVDGGEVAGLVTIAACYVESAAQ